MKTTNKDKLGEEKMFILRKFNPSWKEEAQAGQESSGITATRRFAERFLICLAVKSQRQIYQSHLCGVPQGIASCTVKNRTNQRLRPSEKLFVLHTWHKPHHCPDCHQDLLPHTRDRGKVSGSQEHGYSLTFHSLLCWMVPVEINGGFKYINGSQRHSHWIQLLISQD